MRAQIANIADKLLHFSYDKEIAGNVKIIIHHQLAALFPQHKVNGGHRILRVPQIESDRQVKEQTYLDRTPALDGRVEPDNQL